VALTTYSKQEAEAIKSAWFMEAGNDIQFFAETMLPGLLQAKVPDFHSEIYKLLPENKRLIIAAPRGFAKSYLCSIIYPIWLGCFCMYKDITIISASETLAKEMLRKIKREFESNQILRETFGDMITDKWSETHAVLTSGVTFRARGCEAQIRGFRPECVIIDDIETDETTKSEEQRQKLQDFIFKSCMPALTPYGQMIIVGSIINQLAVLKQLLDTDNGWNKRLYKAYKGGVEQPGQELWPELWPHNNLQMMKKTIGSWRFSSEYMNDPKSSDTASIRQDLIKRWKELPSQMSCVITVDPAYSEEDKADWKVASLIGIDQNMNRYLIHYIRTHAPQGEFIDAVLSMWQSNKNSVTALGIPAQGLESEIFRSFVNKANDKKIYPPFTELKNTFVTPQGSAKRGKASRIIAALQPLFEQGKYYIGQAHQEAYEELASLNPNLDQRWDDIIDTLAYGESLLQPVFIQQDMKFDQVAKTMPNNYGWD
jgi:phage terminase large subunit-like protein